LELALACFLSRGHLLIEDLPGNGKTTFSHTIAKCLGLDFKRLQFTADLLPADVMGVNVYDSGKNHFSFHPGPIFTQFLLADEINRSSPKTQSALLEAMEEGQVTIDGHSHCLPKPFFVVATQNPLRQIGTFPLPESQLDRFLMRIELGYPDHVSERRLLQGHDRRLLLEDIRALVDGNTLLAWQQQASHVYMDAVVLDYIQNLVLASRQQSFICGLSPRAALSLVHAAKAWAWLHGRDHVLPDDIQMLLPPVANHRLHFSAVSSEQGDPASRILHAVEAP